MVMAGASDARHCAQNLAFGLLFAPQFGQFMIDSTMAGGSSAEDVPVPQPGP